MLRGRRVRVDLTGYYASARTIKWMSLYAELSEKCLEEEEC